MAEGVQIIWTPWRSHDELLQNRSWLFPESCVSGKGPGSRRKACDQVMPLGILQHRTPPLIDAMYALSNHESVQDANVKDL